MRRLSHDDGSETGAHYPRNALTAPSCSAELRTLTSRRELQRFDMTYALSLSQVRAMPLHLALSLCWISTERA